VKKASKKELYSYGIHSFGQFFAIIMITMYFTVFLTENVGMSAALAGTCLLLARGLDFFIGLIAGGVIQAKASKGKYYSYWINGGRFIVLIGSILSFTNTSSLPMTTRFCISLIDIYLLTAQ